MDSFYEELGRVFDQFPRYDMKILLGDFNAKVGREDIFKPTMGNESSHEISNDNGVRVVNFATSKYLVVKSTMFPHRRGCGLDSNVSGQGQVAGCCECGDEPSGSCATELVSYLTLTTLSWLLRLFALSHLGPEPQLL
jgi:hypothetical protein